ncbi:MAG TPA: S8 family serine peptidase [Acidimicrobiales bacterium]|nr:S8 family serine peptidase [Acidimicrobiales bacterium]
MPPRFRLLVSAVLTLALMVVARPATAIADPRLPEQWGLAAIGAPAAWSVGTGNGVTIAVVDTGADFGHEDLGPKLLPGRNFVEPGAPPQDDQGHGSHVAGIAAAATGNGVGVAGVAPGARILPVKVLDSGGSGSVAVISDGIRWAAANGAQVINLSLGPNAVLATLFGSGLEDAVNDAWNMGSVVVIAAGNDFLFSSSYSTVNAVIVTSTTREDRLASSYASAVGSAKWGIAAPGGAGGSSAADDILSSYWRAGARNSYEFLAGTSMATPHVAGAAAVLRGLGLSPQQTVDRLLATAKDLGSPGRDSTYGAGRLDLAAAVAAVAPPAVPPATTPPGRVASPAPAPAPKTPAAPVAPRPAPTPVGVQQPATTVPSPAEVAAPATGTPASPPAPAEVAAPLPGSQKRASSNTGDHDDGRPWLPLGGATVTLAGSGLALLWVQRRFGWA